MALIEVFTHIATNLDIDPDVTTNIPQGSIVTLDSNGLVELCDENSKVPVGIAADTRSTGITSYTPESGSALSTNPTSSLEGALVTSAFGDGQRFTQNRVADNYNEVFASGKMTVYHSGGEFWTDQYEVVDDDGSTATTYTPGTQLYSSDQTSITGSNGGKFTDDSTSKTGPAFLVGVTLHSPTGYPSGVPGTGNSATAFQALPEGGNSLSWGSFLHLKLLI